MRAVVNSEHNALFVLIPIASAIRVGGWNIM